MVAPQHIELPGAPDWLTVVVAVGAGERRGLAADALTTLIETLLPGRTIMRGPDGQPIVRGGGVHISLSHADGATALALAPYPVGIDVERVDGTLDALSLDPDLLGRNDYELLCACDGVERNALFYRLWTLKEARLKQRGQSLVRAALPPIMRNEREAVMLMREGRVGDHMSTCWANIGGTPYCVAVCWSPRPSGNAAL